MSPLGSREEQERQELFERDERELDRIAREDLAKEKGCRADEILELQEWACPRHARFWDAR